jgi:hypothetical protein
MYFGYRAHREHGLGWNAPRSGKQMQDDPATRCTGTVSRRKRRATARSGALSISAKERGYGPREIVDAFDKGADGTVAELRRRTAALAGAGG